MTDETSNGQAAASDATGASPQGPETAPVATIGPSAAERNRKEFASGVDPRGIDELEKDGAISKAEADNLRRIKANDAASPIGVAGWGEKALGDPRPPKLADFKDRSKQDVLGFQKTTTPPTVGRCLHFYRKVPGTRAIQGPMDGHVVVANLGSPFVNVCVLPSYGGPDAKVDVFSSVTVFQPIAPDARMEGLDQLPDYWAEWMPYQAGQAQRTDQAEGKLLARAQRLELAVLHLARHISNDGTVIDQRVAEIIGGE